MHHLILLTTEGCHLCERAFDEIELCSNEFEVTVQEVDIVSDPDLVRQYGTRIPVLLFANKPQKLFWPFDRIDIAQRLSDE